MSNDEKYRLNIKLPSEYGDYLREMAWQSKITIGEYVKNCIDADMQKHPEWRDSLDELNVER